MKEEIRWFEQMLQVISDYQGRNGHVFEDFASKYGLSLEIDESPRPVIKGISTSAVIREIREGRWRRYT